MLFLSIVQNYLLWHYTRAFSEIFHVWFNFIWFIVHFFSMPQLIRSWFEPWKRITESRGRGFNLEDLAGYVIIGLLSRIVGFILRSSIISLGLFCLLLLVVAGFALYTLWVALPLIIVAMFVFGLTLLIA